MGIMITYFFAGTPATVIPASRMSFVTTAPAPIATSEATVQTSIFHPL